MQTIIHDVSLNFKVVIQSQVSAVLCSLPVVNDVWKTLSGVTILAWVRGKVCIKRRTIRKKKIEKRGLSNSLLYVWIQYQVLYRMKWMATFVLPITIHISVAIQRLTTLRIISGIWNSLLHCYLHPKSSVMLWESLSLGLILQEWRQAFIISKELSHR